MISSTSSATVGPFRENPAPARLSAKRLQPRSRIWTPARRWTLYPGRFRLASPRIQTLSSMSRMSRVRLVTPPRATTHDRKPRLLRTPQVEHDGPRVSPHGRSCRRVGQPEPTARNLFNAPQQTGRQLPRLMIRNDDLRQRSWRDRAPVCRDERHEPQPDAIYLLAIERELLVFCYKPDHS
jgi:hypothetical protein